MTETADLLVAVDDHKMDFIRPSHVKKWAVDYLWAKSPEEVDSLELGPGLADRQADLVASVLVILDLMFALGDWEEGVRYLQRIRQGHTPLHRRTPVLVVSAAAKREECLAAGANDFIRSTAPRGEIRNKVGYYLGKRVVTSIYLCRIERIDFSQDHAQVVIRDEGSRSTLKRLLSIHKVPAEARFPGSVFELTSSFRFSHFEDEQSIRPRPLEDPEGEKALDLLFSGVEEDG